MIDTEKASYSIVRLCHVLGVSKSGFYAWKSRGPSLRLQRDRSLIRLIRRIHTESECTYGAPRTHAELRLGMGLHCSRKRVARLMRLERLSGVHRGSRPHGTTRRDPRRPVAPDLVHRAFEPDAPNRLWMADITQHPTYEGWLYLAAITDACSRKVVGWAMDEHIHADLVVNALNMAIRQRRPAPGLIHHSDHGAQYTSLRFSQALDAVGILQAQGNVFLAFGRYHLDDLLPRLRGLAAGAWNVPALDDDAVRFTETTAELSGDDLDIPAFPRGV